MCTHGQFPLLGSTESLLGKLGFELCDDLKNVHNDDDNGGESGHSCTLLADLIHPSEDTSPTDTESERLSDVLLRCMDDVRDFRHRVEEEEEETGEIISRKEKRLRYKVDSLEKQRAKLQEKQKQNETGGVLVESGHGDATNDNCAEICDAWIRMARTFNSVRLLLFLFSEEDGLDMLANYDNRDGEESGLKNLSKIVAKLSDALEVLAIPSTPVERNGGNNDDSNGITKKAKSKWEHFISAGIQSRRSTSSASSNNQSDRSENGIDLVNFSAIDLTDDSSASSDLVEARNDENLLDDLSEAMLANVPDVDNTNVEISLAEIENEDIPPQSVEISNEKAENCIPAPLISPTKRDKNKNFIPDRCVSWNAHLDKNMEDLVSAMNTKSGGENTTYLDQIFAADGGNSSAVRLQKRARFMDGAFSLNAGKTDTGDYRKRKQYLISIEKLRYRLEQKIRHGRGSGEFADARLDVYGSCLSGLSLGKNADVDLSLTFSEAVEKKNDFEAGYLAAKKYARHVTDTVYKIKRKLESGRRERVNEFRDIEAVARARVPVIKGVYSDANNPHSEDGSLHFDICLLNDIAVANSGLIKEYSDIDIRVKSLMIAVKRWTKDNNINAAQDNTLSSYTWINLVIFYLQCIGFVPNLQCSSMMRECNHEMGEGRSKRRQDNINSLNTAYLNWRGQADRVWKRSKEIDDAYGSVSLLLYGFFRFYSREFPIHLYMVSIKRGGNIRIPKTMFSDRASLHFCIEDPFETYDSHFPHDLGRPADETGSMLISQCFRNSEEHLRGLLFGEATPTNVELWPITTLERDTSGRSRKNRNYKANSKAEIRPPQMTLVVDLASKVHNIEDLLKIFQPFADRTGARIVGSSLVKRGRLAFVDYDSIAAAEAAIAAHEKTPLKINGMALQVAQKGGALPKSAEKTPRKEDDPGKTLVIQSNSGCLSKKGMDKIFRVFAEGTNSKLVTIDLIKKGKEAIVEYDSSAAVTSALGVHANNPLVWNGKALGVSQKMASDGNPPKKKGGKKKQGKKKPYVSRRLRSDPSPTRKNKTIINANESIQGQI